MLRHLIVCREYPPAPYPPGGIGTYVRHISRLLAEAGETVHVVAQQWEGAAQEVSSSVQGRLIVHRVPLDRPLDAAASHTNCGADLLRGLAESDCPAQLFAWQAGQLIERLAGEGDIDVIEGQEWEAPLYFLQLRRAMGLGPRRQPPVLVHLHSPSCLIFRHNSWDTGLRDFAPLSRMEAYSIRAADQVICPSRFLAHEAEGLFGLERGSVEVVPYPLGQSATVERGREVWQRQTIAYAGRLELRKGILEWVDAAVQAAVEHPAVSFEFFGSDTSRDGRAGSSVLEHLKKRIPQQVAPRFRFFGSQPQEKLRERLARVPVVAVPSRWDNLPFTCIEAMAAGLPVLTSPNGGMTELVRDGVSGWVARGTTADSRAEAIRRVLETPAEQRAAMGRAAAKAVNAICGNQPVVERHLDLHERMAAAGTSRSRFVPGTLRGAPTASGSRGIGVVITAGENEGMLGACLDSIRRQTQPPVAVVTKASGRHARRSGSEALLKQHPNLAGVVFLESTVLLQPDFVERAEALFARQPNVDAMVSWVLHTTPEPAIDTNAPDISAADFLDDDAGVCGAVRACALKSLLGSPVSGVEQPGTTVTFPAPMVSSVLPMDRTKTACVPFSAMVASQNGSNRLSLRSFLTAPASRKALLLRGGIANPRRAGQWLVWQLRRAAFTGR